MGEEKTIYGIINVIEASIIDPFERLLFVVAVAVFLWGVIEFIAGASNEKARTDGKKHMMWGVIGFVIIISSKVIITVLKNFFDNIR